MNKPASELIALADNLDGWHDCADGDVNAGNGHFRLQCISDSDQQRLNLRAVLREASKALRVDALARGQYVVRKGGYFYRPNAQGYTSSIYEAGLWPETEARKYADGCEGVTVHAASEFTPPAQTVLATPPTESNAIMTDEQIKHMVDRFLMWKLPEHFNPDCGISFDLKYRDAHSPIGTNLFDAVQATDMVRHMLDGMPTHGKPDGAMREALEFGIWAVSGPTNEAEVERLEQIIEETWREYQTKALHSPKIAAADNIETCIACNTAFVEGDMVYPDASGGSIHASCCGPERESYVNADGEPLKDGDPLPTPQRWTSAAAETSPADVLDVCPFCFGSGRHEGRFGHNDPECTNCNGVGKVAIDRLDVKAEAKSQEPEAVAVQERKWKQPVKTVADLVNNLMTIDQTMDVHAAYFITHGDGRKETRTRSPSLSRERVANSRINNGDEAVPYSLVIWTSQDERSTTKPEAPAVSVDAETLKKSCMDCMNGYLSVHARKDGTFEIWGADRAATGITSIVSALIAGGR